MRSDFQKLLCECYRVGRGWALSSKALRSRVRNSKNREDGEFYSSKISHTKLIGWSHKSFGENLSPLKRFIHKQVGKKWDRVYSEICKHNNKAGAVGQHIFQHLYDFIIIDVEKEDRIVYHKTSSWRGSGRRELRFGDLYVDPEDNIIKKYKRNKRQLRAPKPITRYILDNGNALELFNGIWYYIEYGAVPKPFMRLSVEYIDGERVEKMVKHYPKVKCVLRGLISYGTDSIYAKSKKQMNTKELKRFELKNIA